MLVDITGVDKVLLLRFLWEKSIPSRFYIGPTRFSQDSILKALAKGRIDYFYGRRIGIDLTGNLVDPTRYDCFLGQGEFLDAVDQCRRC